MKIAIIGTRYPPKNVYRFVLGKLKYVCKKENISLENIHIISGGAKGVDTMAQLIAKKYGLSITIHYPNWEKYGKKAGFIRNKKIINDADIVVAFPLRDTNKSPGTYNSIKLAKKQRKKVYIFSL